MTKDTVKVERNDGVNGYVAVKLNARVDVEVIVNAHDRLRPILCSRALDPPRAETGASYTVAAMTAAMPALATHPASAGEARR